MTSKQFQKLLKSFPAPKTFQAINFGCRVNAAETNQLAQILINQDFKPAKSKTPSLILINTCAVTKKGQKESIRKIKSLSKKHPQTTIIVTGCASLKKIKKLPKVYTFKNTTKQTILKNQKGYTQKIGDKYSSSKRYILKVQDGCNHFCTYCIVPQKRSNLWSLPITQAINSVDQTVKSGYQEIIITGTNLNLYTPKLEILLKNLLDKTAIPKITFGSIPLNCINSQFINLYKNKSYSSHLSHFLHIPIQSGSTKVLKAMNRPYTRKDIINSFNELRQIKELTFGTDVIVGFPNETKKDFQETLNLCKDINFTKIHVFRYSPRPGTSAKILFDQLPKIKNSEKIHRSRQLRQL